MGWRAGRLGGGGGPPAGGARHLVEGTPRRWPGLVVEERHCKLLGPLPSRRIGSAERTHEVGRNAPVLEANGGRERIVSGQVRAAEEGGDLRAVVEAIYCEAGERGRGARGFRQP